MTLHTEGRRMFAAAVYAPPLPDRLRHLADAGHPRADELRQRAEKLEAVADTLDDPDDLDSIAAWDRARTLYDRCMLGLDRDAQGHMETEAAISTHRAQLGLLPEAGEPDPPAQARVVSLMTGFAPDNASLAEHLRAVADVIESRERPYGELRNVILLAERMDGTLYREVMGDSIDAARATGLCFTASVQGIFRDADE